MKVISPEDVHAVAVAQLGLDAGAVDLTAIEAVAAALRRAAGFLCPCAASTLVRAVVRPMDGLVADMDEFKEAVETTLDAIVAQGDLIEQRELNEVGRAAVLLYPAPPGFVRRQSGAAILLGITPDQRSPLPEGLDTRIQYVNHVRRLMPRDTEDLRAVLTGLGLIELSFDRWLKAPPQLTPEKLLSRLDALLDEAPPSGDVPGLILLEPSRPVRYYRGRWTELHAQSGRFVARRRQAYGADLWCYVQVKHGLAERFVDFPAKGSRLRGCDEAWRAQMAVDARRGEPQEFRVRQGLGGARVLQLFSPVPMWVQRKWDVIGEPTPSSGCLFAYRFTDAEMPEEVQFLRDALWLSETR